MTKISAPPRRAEALARYQSQAERYTDILQRYTGTTVPATTTVICTLDGILIASQVTAPEQRPAQLAAMASSLLAVAAAAGREVGHTRAGRMVIESPSGTLLVKPLGRTSDLALCMALPADTVLGKALWAADAIAEAVKAV